MGRKRLNSYSNKKPCSLRRVMSSDNYDFTPTHNYQPWVRNPAWLDMPTMTSSDEKFCALMGLDDTTENHIRIYVASSGTYDIDWGDGNTTTHTGNLWHDHTYDYNEPSIANTDVPVTFGSNVVTLNNHGYTDGMRIDFYSSTVSDVEPHVYYWVVNATTNTFQLALLEDGTPLTIGTGTGTILSYKQVMITITPVDPLAGDNITQIQLNSRNPALAFDYLTNWREVECSLPNCTNLLLGYEYNQSNYLVERLKVHTLSSSYTNFQQGLRLWWGVEEIDINFNGATLTDLYYAFNSCHMAATINLSNVSLNGRIEQAFNSCWRLREFPAFDSVSLNGQNANSAFANCYNIKRIPFDYFADSDWNTTSTIGSLVRSNFSLQESPYSHFDTSNISTMYYLFGDTRSLSKTGYYNTNSATRLDGTCYFATQLTELPVMTISANTTHISNMTYYSPVDEIRFYANTAGPLSGMTSVNDAFHHSTTKYFDVMVSGANTDNKLNIPNVSSVSRMFYNAYGMRKVPEFTTSSTLTNLYQFMQYTSLKEIPFDSSTFDVSSVTNAGYAFYLNRLLKELPALDFTSCTNALNMCANNTSMVKVNSLTFPALQTAQGLFSNCVSLVEIPEIDFPEVTNPTSMFSNSWSLKHFKIMLPKATTINSLFYNTQQLERIYISAPLATTGPNAFSTQAYGGYSGLEQLTADLSSMGSNQTLFTYSTKLKKLLLTINDNFTLQQLDMSGAALNNLYTYLPTVSGKTINITNNRGRSSDDPSIATAKGWTVTG